MKILSVFDPAFAPYGKVLTGYDLSAFLDVLARQEQPEGAVVYVPSCKALEELPVFEDLKNRAYGGMPIQIGYCNGFNTHLGCLEYHRDSEVNIASEDAVLLLGLQEKIDYEAGTYDTAEVEAFLIPAGTAVEVYATTLHYAPCDGIKGCGFHVAVVLPRDTNTEAPVQSTREGEAGWLTARNKWSLAHPTAPEASQTTGRLLGEDPDILGLL